MAKDDQDGMKANAPILSRLCALVALLVWWCAMLAFGFDAMDLTERECET